MNNRFKFRTWNPDLKSFTYWGWIKEGEYKNLCACREISKDELLEKYTQQCIGLKDKNGTLIYEGDIILNEYGKWFIKYCDKCKSFQCFENNYGCYNCLGDYSWADFIEDLNYTIVGGNIYENPELLKDGEE